MSDDRQLSELLAARRRLRERIFKISDELDAAYGPDLALDATALCERDDFRERRKALRAELKEVSKLIPLAKGTPPVYTLDETRWAAMLEAEQAIIPHQHWQRDLTVATQAYVLRSLFKVPLTFRDRWNAQRKVEGLVPATLSQNVEYVYQAIKTKSPPKETR